MTSPDTSLDTPTLLRGRLVLELSQTRSAAFAGKLLADAGADVLVVDSAQRRDDLSDSARLFLDPYKEVLRPAAGHDDAWLDAVAREELVPLADLLITDLPAADLVARGWDWATLSARNPALSLVQLSADPSGAAATEVTMQALSGVMEMVGHVDREPLALPYGIGAYQLGLHGAASAGAALVAAHRSGQGRHVQIAGSEVLASYVRIYGAVASYYDIPLRREGRRAPGSGGRYPFGFFPCKDGYVAMICRSEREWASLLEMMGNPAWAQQERYQDLYAIAIEYPDEIDALIAPWLMSHTRDELLELAQQHQIPVAPVRSVDEVLADDQLREHRLFFDAVRTADGREIFIPGRPWASPARSARIGRPAETDQIVQRRRAAARLAEQESA